MTMNRPSIDIREHPVGYITDSLPQKLTENSSEEEAMYQDISITLKNMPEAANVKIHVKVLNFTASNDPSFTIKTWPKELPDDSKVTEFISQKNLTYHFFPIPASDLEITYRSKNQETTGEFVNIMYTGLSALLYFPFNQA